MPESSRDFQKAARQRLTTAQFLLINGYNLDAMYLAGYVVECSLKALILFVTVEEERAEILARITKGHRMHLPEVLANQLSDLGHPLPMEFIKKFRRFPWTTSLRYASGRVDSGETRGWLKTAQEVFNWVEGQLP